MESHRKQTKSYENRVIKYIESFPDKKYGFTEFEIGILKKYYATKNISVLAKALNKSVRQIRDKAYSLGLRKRDENLILA